MINSNYSTNQNFNINPTIVASLHQLEITIEEKQSKKNTVTSYNYFQFPAIKCNINSLINTANNYGINITQVTTGTIEVSWDANQNNYYQDNITAIFQQIIQLIPQPMSWVKLINPTKSKKQVVNLEYLRNTFEHDSLRIISSESFRRLQNKTQVIPLSDSDNIHNRLTHSIEVAMVGKKLANMVARNIWDSHLTLANTDTILNKYQCGSHEAAGEIFVHSISEIVHAACLIHDIGNPPFGHQGEEALKETYAELIQNPFYQDTLAKLAINNPDLFQIEGNAQTIRLIATNQNIDLTYATLAASIKYPRIYNQQQKSIYKKFNIYHSEQPLFKQITQSCGLNPINNTIDYQRHPLVYLVEAADDICYSLFDFEDFVTLGFISQQVYCDTLIKIIIPNMQAPKAKQVTGDTIEEKRSNFAKLLHERAPDFANLASMLRSDAIHQLTLNAAYAFKVKYDSIIRGVYTQQNQLLNAKGQINGLLDIYEAIMQTKNSADEFANSNQDLKKYSISAGYNHLAVLKNSLGGYTIISELLKIHIAALHNLYLLKSQMVLSIMPPKYILAKLINALKIKEYPSWVNALSTTEQIEQIRLINDYLTGLTDTAALKLFRHLKGHEQISI